jgi:L-asparaginase
LKFNESVKTYIEQGGIVLNITQCSTGKVEQGRYETSSFLQKSGVLGGSDLTTEAALTKMMYVLGKSSDVAEISSLLVNDLAGEMSSS